MNKFTWPSTGDMAFKKPSFPLQKAQIGAFVLSWPAGHALGFKQAADMIVEAAQSDAQNPDLLFCPVAYLYRHYLELTLKELVEMGLSNGDISVSDNRLHEHDLRKLWIKARELIDLVWPSVVRADTDAVERVILEFHQIDKNGDGFRYATDKSGGRNLKSAPYCVCMANMKETMEKISRYLDATNAGIDNGRP